MAAVTTRPLLSKLTLRAWRLGNEMYVETTGEGIPIDPPAADVDSDSSDESELGPDSERDENALLCAIERRAFDDDGWIDSDSD
jgi:hypothetical protein